MVIIGIREQLMVLRQKCSQEARKRLRETHVGHPRMNPSQNVGGCSNPEEMSEPVSLELVRLNDHTCRAVDRALARLEAGTYGICRNCDKPISSSRLHAIPYATLCIVCQTGEERPRECTDTRKSPFLPRRKSALTRLNLAWINAKFA